MRDRAEKGKGHEKENEQDDNGTIGGVGKSDHEEDKDGKKAPPEVDTLALIDEL